MRCDQIDTLIPRHSILTQSQVQASASFYPLLETTADLDTLLGTAADLATTAADFLRFVTEFFEVISQSAPHIYQSALPFAPQSSVVRKLYEQYISFPRSTVVTNIPLSWGLYTASAGAAVEVNCAVWSPCDQFIAIGWVDRVEIRNPSTLLSRSILKPPDSSPGMLVTPQSLAFSSDGRMLACAYHR